MISWPAADADATRACGARLARALLALPVHDDVFDDAAITVTLEGELGAGKTTFVAGLLAALGHDGPVRSPTYTLIEPYRLAGREIQHCDLYRLRHPDELEEIGWRDLRLPGTILLVEWPEKAGAELGPVDVAVQIRYEGADARAVSLLPRSPMGQRVLDFLE